MRRVTPAYLIPRCIGNKGEDGVGERNGDLVSKQWSSGDQSRGKLAMIILGGLFAR